MFFLVSLRAAQRIGEVLAARNYALSSTTVLEADTLAVKATAIGQPVSLVITSPPYPNAYEYWLYHKYRMWWLGFLDPIAVKEREIGARAHISSNAIITRQQTLPDKCRRRFVFLRGL